MNKNLYGNVILTLLFCLLLFLAVAVITALDRHRFALEELSAAVKRLESRQVVAAPVSQASSAANAVPAQRQRAANAEYFDPASSSGGRLVRAFSADVGNMNMLINNDSYVSQIWEKVNDTLAERDYMDDGSGKYFPKMAVSWKVYIIWATGSIVFCLPRGSFATAAGKIFSRSRNSGKSPA